MITKLEGDGPIQKHIILLKLQEALENTPSFGDKPISEVGTPQRQWLSEVGLLLSRLDLEKKVQFRASFNTLTQYWKPAIIFIRRRVRDRFSLASTANSFPTIPHNMPTNCPISIVQ